MVQIHKILAVLLCAGLATAGLSTAVAAGKTPAPLLDLRSIAGQPVRAGYGSVVRLGQRVTIIGTVAHLRSQERIELQGRTTSAWHTLATAAVKGGTFTFHWAVRTRENQLKAVLAYKRHDVAQSASAAVLVGSAIVPCRAVSAPSLLPAGDGWIEGGIYLYGGPAPGVDQCQAESSTLTATPTSGGPAVSTSVLGGDGYVVALPAGTYDLQAGQCTGTATVRAGRETVADTDCNFP